MPAQLETNQDFAAALAFIVERSTDRIVSRRQYGDDEVKLHVLAHEFVRYMPRKADKIVNAGRRKLAVA